MGPKRDLAQWAMAVQTVYGFLTWVARSEGKVESGDIYKLAEAAIGMRITRWQTSDLLDAILRKAAATHDVMLSRLVVPQETSRTRCSPGRSNSNAGQQCGTTTDHSDARQGRDRR